MVSSNASGMIPVIVAFDAHDVRAPQPHLAHRAQVDVLLGQQHVARVRHRLDQHVDCFAGARRQYDVVGRDVHLAVPSQLIRDQFAQGERYPAATG